MDSAQSLPRHKNTRLDVRSYRGYGWYFLTLCTYKRIHYFRSHDVATRVLRTLHVQTDHHGFRQRAYCLMPNHLHLLLQAGAPNCDLLQCVRTFKHKTSFHFRATSGQTLWQVSFYDHVLRASESPADVAWYILLNPVRAGLVKTPIDYPYCGPFVHGWPGTEAPSTPWSPAPPAEFKFVP
ncbi:MAG TPA: transposase [Candidatus Saccharimonadales bacterium]|nr:transposase [Candidatus Saccharimonadales bacterium]